MITKTEQHIRELEKQLGVAKNKRTKQRNCKWNKEASEFVKKNIGKTYKNSMCFPGSKEEVKYWVYKVLEIDKRSPIYEIIMSCIYISIQENGRQVAKLERKSIWSSCPYITHGLDSCDKQLYEEALEELIRLS